MIGCTANECYIIGKNTGQCTNSECKCLNFLSKEDQMALKRRMFFSDKALELACRELVTGERDFLNAMTIRDPWTEEEWKEHFLREANK